VLLITSPEDVESRLTTRVYPVLDLITPRQSGRLTAQHPFATDYDSLIDLLTLTIAPQSWDDVGGPGSIEPHDNTASLVVSQTREVHIQLESLLITLRRVKATQPYDRLTIPFANRTLASRPSSSASRPYAPPTQPK
jgi:hypothetical protein